MCLIAVAHGVDDRHALVVAANRDERHARPSSAAEWWVDAPEVLGGRDLVAGGTWLAVSRTGRFAAVTNVHEPGAPAAARSRGLLVTDWLGGSASAEDAARSGERPDLSANASAETYSRSLARHGADYGPFNLLLFDGVALHYVSNRANPAVLPAGIHGLGNSPLGTHWPKVRRAMQGLAVALDADDPVEPLFELLTERKSDSADERRYTHDLFVVGSEFGTRSSTVVLIGRDRSVTLVERRFDAGAHCIGESRYSFQVRNNAAAGVGEREATANDT